MGPPFIRRSPWLCWRGQPFTSMVVFDQIGSRLVTRGLPGVGVERAGGLGDLRGRESTWVHLYVPR